MMKLIGMLPFRTALFGLIMLAAFARADDLSTEYCSTVNTGTDGPFYSIYNSMGACQTQCQDNYAFGIVQGKNCWCGNYIPAQQGSVSDCNSACPGFPSDLCGNPGRGMYGYIPLGISPSGTAGASSSPPPTSTKTSTSQVSPTVTKTVTEEESASPSVVVSFVTPTSSDPPPSSSSSSSSASKDTTTTKSLVMTQVTTISGSAVTHTVTSTPVGMSPNDNGSDPPRLERTGLSAGAIAGIIVGLLLGIGALAFAAFLLWRRRRSGDSEGGLSGSPKRKGSVLSRAGLLGGAARPQSMAEINNYDEPHSADPVTRSNSIRNSMMFGSGMAGEGVAAAGPLGSSSDTSSERRQSKPMVYDQRLNPSALFAHHDNGSRVSMQDQQDYSRPLGLTNPDFPRSYSFDSR